MTRNRCIALLLAAVAALILCACGAAAETSSAPEGINTFGFPDVDPSAQPSAPQNLPNQGVTASTSPAAPGGPIIEGTSGSAPSPEQSPEVALPEPVVPVEVSTAPSQAPAGTYDPTEPPETSPVISPPAPASTVAVVSIAS